MTAGTLLLAVLLLLLPGCARHKKQQSSYGAEEQPAGATLPIGSSETPSLTPVASPFPNPEVPVTSRPSPFSDLREADRQQVASTAAVPGNGTAAKAPKATSSTASADAVRKPLKPFVPKPADLSIAPNSRDRVGALPGPPVLAAIPPTVAPPVTLSPRPCCVSTAFVEPARPARLQRVLRRVPGIRRIGQHPETEDGFVAAQPAREITLLLPPEARATLRDGRMDLKARVDESGHVTRVELLWPKDEELVRLASYAASAWPFTPARLNEKAVPSEMILHFNFGN